MARNSYGIGQLNAAAPGLSKLAQALVGGQGAYQQGFQGSIEAQSKIAQTLAQVREQNAAAAAHQAQADEFTAKTGVLNRRPDLFSEQVANAAGTDVPTVSAFRTQLRTGQAPLVPMGPPTEEGAMGQGSLVLPDAVKSKLAGALQQFLPILSNAGDLNPEQLAAAAQKFRASGLGDQILAGTLDRNKVAGAQAAIEGKALYNTNGDGAVLDQYGGQLDTNNPMAGATIGLRKAQAGEAGARAGLARAQADDARAGKFDAGSGTVIDVRTGHATPVVDVTTGKPIGGKASGGLNQEQANALGFGSRMQDANKVLEQLATQGTMRPGNVYSSVSAIPGIGGVMGDLTNFTQSDAQQQVDQAQRNFINATLRRESGASISPGEFENARKQYFPQPGDKPGVLAQKASNRQRVIQSMFAAVPPNMRELPPLPGSTDAPAGKPIAVDY
jgi:hypothetical protein